MKFSFATVVKPIYFPLPASQLSKCSYFLDIKYSPTPFTPSPSDWKLEFLHRRRNKAAFLTQCVQISTSSDSNDFIVVNFYQFVDVKDPEAEVAKHQSFLKGVNIHGRIYISEQGINAQFSGPSKDALAYADWVKDDARFSNTLVQVSPALNGHAFPRLRLRYKSSLVQLDGGISHLPLTDPSMRATPLSTSEWKRKLESDDESSVILDVRNGYEWDIGHFSGSQRPEVDCFRKTSFGLSGKETANILMYCTGGIRCDVYSTILKQKGFEKVFTLKGGVSHFLEKEGPEKWIGNLFVFDDRLSLPPATYKGDASSVQLKCEKPSSARCFVCGERVSELKHRNCANIDCNLLFLCCFGCVEDLGGCCCRECTAAPRLRPALPTDQRYKKWYTYREQIVSSSVTI